MGSSLKNFLTKNKSNFQKETVHMYAATVKIV